MSTTTATTPAAPRRGGWLRILAWVLGGLLLLLVIVYFVATSAAFLKSFVLPRAGKAMNATITVADASISPFSQVVLKDLRVQTTGTEPLLIVPELRASYSLMDIIKGRILVNEVAVSSPIITLVENADGTSNLDPLLKSSGEKPKQTAPQTSTPPQIDIRKVALTDATLRKIKVYKNGNQDTAAISHLTVILAGLKNGQTGKLDLNADISLDNNPPAPAAKASVQAKANAVFSLGLSQDLKPSLIQGNGRLAVTRAAGALAQAADLNVLLDCDVSPSEIKRVAVQLQRNGASLGELLVHGPFSMEKNEGRLAVELFGIDKNLLNVAGAAAGVDFGPTTINSTNQIEIAKSGALLGVNGQFNLNQLQITQTNQTTPALDFHANYDLTVDQAGSNATIRSLALNGVQNGSPFLRGELSNPMALSWGNSANALSDATLTVTVTGLDLANWKAFLADVAPAGQVSATAKLLSQKGGKTVSIDLNSEISNLVAGAGTNQVAGLAVALKLRGQAEDMKKYALPAFSLDVSRQNQALLSLTGTGSCAPAEETADFQLNGRLMLAALSQALARPDLNVSSGTSEISARIAQQKKTQTVTGSLTLADLTGRIPGGSFQSYGATADFDLAVTGLELQIRKVAGKLTAGKADGGSFNLSGSCNLTNQSTQISLKLDGFNQNGLRPFLEPALGDKKLVSVALNGNVGVTYSPAGASTVKGSLAITNLVVNDPKGQVPASPLAISSTIDVGMNKSVIDLRQVQLGLTPTTRAANQINLTGRIDQSDTNGVDGNLKLTSDGLDVTTYYDLFGPKAGATSSTTASPTPAPGPAPAAGNPQEEAKPIKLPVKTFAADASIARFYLREVEITNFQFAARIVGSHVTIDPCKLSVNGAPANAKVDLDLGVPGYKYDVSLNADRIPMAPLANSFDPDHKGRLGGTVSALGKITGAGTTGASLRKNLAGQFDVGTTNLNLSVGDIRSPLLKSLINVVTMLPDLLKNPDKAPGLLLGALGLTSGQQGGLSAELSQSPIDQIVARGSIANGAVDLQQSLVQSPAFRAEAAGTITLADIPTNSTMQIPVSLSLSRPIAQKINAIPAGTPTNATYVKLPDFLTMKGTVGQPRTDINKLALAGTVLKSIGTAIPGSGTAGNIVQDITGLFGGKSASSTNASPAATNQPAPKSGGLLQGIGNLLGGGSPPATNQPPTATATNTPPAKNLLNDLFGPGRK